MEKKSMFVKVLSRSFMHLKDRYTQIRFSKKLKAKMEKEKKLEKLLNE